MITCEECGVSIRAETHPPPIWGVQTVKGGHIKSHYFCSKEHADNWSKEKNYKVVELITDAK